MHQRKTVNEQLGSAALVAKLAAVRSLGALFALVRLCFFASMDDERAAAMRAAPTLAHATAALAYALHSAAWPATENIASEALKLLFHLTMVCVPVLRVFVPSVCRSRGLTCVRSTTAR